MVAAHKPAVGEVDCLLWAERCLLAGLAMSDPVRGEMIPRVDSVTPPAAQLTSGCVGKIAFRKCAGNCSGDEVPARRRIGGCDVAHHRDVEDWAAPSAVEDNQLLIGRWSIGSEVDATNRLRGHRRQTE